MTDKTRAGASTPIAADASAPDAGSKAPAPKPFVQDHELDQLLSYLRQLAGIEKAGGGFPALVGDSRTGLIRKIATLVGAGMPPARLVSCKILLNYFCPAWEAEDLALAELLAEHIPPDLSWSDVPIREATQWH